MDNTEHFDELGDEFEVTTADIARTERTAHIRMISTDISQFLNHLGQPTPMLIVARCKLDDKEYAALFDGIGKKGYAVEVVRKNGEILEFRDLDGLGQDEEWGVISKFFLDNKVYDLNRIILWYRNSKLRKDLSGGKVPIPGTVMQRWKNRIDTRNRK